MTNSKFVRFDLFKISNSNSNNQHHNNNNNNKMEKKIDKVKQFYPKNKNIL